MTPGGTERWSETSRYDERDCPSLRSRPARSLRPCGAAIAAKQCHTARIYHDGKADLFGDDPAGQVIAAAYGQAASKVASASAESGSDPESSNLASCIFHYDSNGNVVLLTDSEGKEAARYAYDAFGKTMLATGPMAQDNKYRFSTKPVEETSGLSFYGYRYYAPQLGRWLSRDPRLEPSFDANISKAAIRNQLPKPISVAQEGLVIQILSRYQLVGAYHDAYMLLNNSSTNKLDYLGLYGCGLAVDEAWEIFQGERADCDESTSDYVDCTICCNNREVQQNVVDTVAYACDLVESGAVTVLTGVGGLIDVMISTVEYGLDWYHAGNDVAECKEDCKQACRLLP